MNSLDGGITGKEQKKDHEKLKKQALKHPKGTIHRKLMSSQYGTQQEINSVRNLWKKSS